MLCSSARVVWFSPNSTRGGGDGGDGDNDDGPPNPPPLQESKSWGPKHSAIPIEMTDQSICCTCKKSKCLKKYCECFGADARCGPNCRCVDCKNQPLEPPMARTPWAMDAAMDLASLRHAKPPAVKTQPIRKAVTEEEPSRLDGGAGSEGGPTKAERLVEAPEEDIRQLLAAHAMAELGSQSQG